jgi:oligosaccharyl transferase complex subunit OST4
MISDDNLYQLAIFLGSISMLLIVLYHFLQVNAEQDDNVALKTTTTKTKTSTALPAAAAAADSTARL